VDNLVALVTGANKGIGKEIARQLADAGLTVYLGSRDPARGERAADEVGGDTRLLVLDRSSKTALNALTVFYARTLAGDGIRVNALAPGLRRTDLNATAAASDGDPADAAGAVWLALLPDDGPTGEFFSWDGTPIPCPRPTQPISSRAAACCPSAATRVSASPGWSRRSPWPSPEPTTPTSSRARGRSCSASTRPPSARPAA